MHERMRGRIDSAPRGTRGYGEDAAGQGGARVNWVSVAPPWGGEVHVNTERELRRACFEDKVRIRQ